MNRNFLLYAIVVTVVVTVISWASMASTARTGGGNSWRTHGSGSGGYSGGGHK
jgi:hypothetical protein